MRQYSADQVAHMTAAWMTYRDPEPYFSSARTEPAAAPEPGPAPAPAPMTDDDGATGR